MADKNNEEETLDQTKTPQQSDNTDDAVPQESLIRFVTVDGDVFFNYPVKIPIEQHIRNIRVMSTRPDDVLVLAFPKCGTHWIWEVAQMLIAGKAEHDPRSKEQVMLEFNEMEQFQALPSPRVINSHFLPRHLSREIVTQKPRLIHVIRNPKDVAVSSYFHMLQMKGVKDEGFIKFAQGFLQAGLKAVGKDYFVYLQEMMQFQKDNPQIPVLNLYYEEAQKDPVRNVRQIAEFLRVAAGEQLCADIADLCSFKKLKQADETTKDKTGPEAALFQAGVAKLFRKGEVGDWKNYFTVALSEEYDRLIAQKLKDCDFHFHFQYTI